MGYQETYLRVKNAKFFDAIVSAINSTGEEYYDDRGFSPVVIFTFIKDHKPFKKGEKAIYFVGDRGCQRCPGDLIGSEYPTLRSDDTVNLLPDDDICEAIFTEEVNSKGIFEDSGKVTDVIVEEFKFSETQPFPDADTCILHFAQNYEETPEDELKFVSTEIKKSPLYKNYEKFRDYLTSKGFKILQGPRDSFGFKAYHDSKIDKEELLQKLNEFGFVLNYVDYVDDNEVRNIFIFNDKDHVSWDGVDEGEGSVSFMEFETKDKKWSINDFKNDILNAYKQKTKLSEYGQEKLEKVNTLIKYLLNSGFILYDVYFDEDEGTYINVKTNKQVNFKELKNEVLKLKFEIRDNTSWENEECYLPGTTLSFYPLDDDDEYLDDYEGNVNKEILSVESNLNDYLANPSIQSTIEDYERYLKSNNPTPKSIYQMNDLCRELQNLDCNFMEIDSPTFYDDDGYYNFIIIEPSEKFDFDKFKEILSKSSFYVESVNNGRITLQSDWDISECNLYWYC